MIVYKRFEFEAAHMLPDYPGKCANLHGHTYKGEIGIEGPMDSQNMVVDFSILNARIRKVVLEKLDHSYLNEFFTTPTVEWMAQWILEHMDYVWKLDHLPGRVSVVRLWETSDNYVEVRPEEIDESELELEQALEYELAIKGGLCV